MPQHYDQHYFARRVEDLGIGVAHASRGLAIDVVSDELRRALEPAFAERAASIAPVVRSDGAAIAASAIHKLLKSRRREHQSHGLDVL
jgi:vancomycin aglycone glucosyltransferase